MVHDYPGLRRSSLRHLALLPAGLRPPDVACKGCPITATDSFTALAEYERRLATFEASRREIQRRWSLVANARLVVFAGAGITTWLALRRSDTGWWIATLVLLVVAFALVVWHGRLRRRRDDLVAMETVNKLAIARFNLDWALVSPVGDTRDMMPHPYARDLDITGDASLVRRISTPVLPMGQETIQQWLLSPADPDIIRDRQAAIRELGARLDLRQQVEAAGRRRTGAFPDPESFLAWTDTDGWLVRRRFLRLVTVVSPVALVALAALFLTGLVTWPMWLIPLAINVIVYQTSGRQVANELDRIAPEREVVTGYADVFQAIGEDRPQAAMLGEIGSALGAAGGASQSMRSLVRIASFAIPRGSILWLPLQLAFLWDTHVLSALERWRRDAGGQPRTWFTRAGEWEALAALAVLAHDFPGWCYPEVDPGFDRVTATGLIHPLIEPGSAVANDVTVGPSGTFLLVTGSNMSGKSTLLRAIGINAALALAGGPVAARSLAMPVVDVWTCMRVEDSLARGVSLFMAELQRLKAVVDAASDAGARPVLYLLDEILQGTNTAERQVASRQVLDHLATTTSIGVVSSHDLDLVAGTSLQDRATCVHFAETFTRDGGQPEMTFDYRLRPGLATTTNALALMDLLGFSLRREDDHMT